MTGKQALLNSINKRAESTAANIIEDGKAKADELSASTRAALEKRLEAALQNAREEAELAYKRRMTVAKLEASKITLQTKQQIVASVYDELYSKIVGMPDKSYADFFIRIAASSVDDGDEVVVAKADTKRLNADFVKKLAAQSKKKITLSKSVCEGNGFILSGKMFDKDFTVASIVAAERDKTETQVSGELFS